MQLKTLFLRNFRNYREELFTFSPGINIISGANAQGKTNLLESLYFLIMGRSFRHAPLSDLIHFGESHFYIEACLLRNGVEEVLKVSCDGVERKIIHNTTSLPTLSALLGILLGVILSPEDDALIRGQPKSRRQFLDLQIAEASPLYLHHLSRYHKAMKHRNVLLRQKDTSTLDIWEGEMAKSAAFLVEERKKATTLLSLLGKRFQEQLSASHDDLALHYKTPSHGNLEDYYLGEFKRLRPRELELGMTLAGPHKDDLEIQIGGKAARFFGSEGQLRTTVSALRLAEWSRLYELTSEKPIFCIDDLAISLDSKREGQLFELMGSLGQVFLTTPRSYFEKRLGSSCVTIENGKQV